MNLVDRYVLREWLKILGLCLCALLGLLLMAAMYDDFGDLLEADAGVIDIVVYFLVKTPSFLSVVLPLTVLISLLYALGVLHRNNEITALRAAGLGIFRITRGIWVVGALLCGLTWYLNSTVIPWSVEESRSIRDNLAFAKERRGAAADEFVGLRTGVAFDNHRAGRMWFFNRYSAYARRGYGATVVELDAERRETLRIVARQASVAVSGGGWVFRDGREVHTDPASGEVVRTVEFTEKRMPGYDEDPALMMIFDVKPSDLSFFELRRIIDYYTIEDNPKVTIYAVRYYGMLADTLGPLIIIVIAVPFAVSGVRVNPAVGVSKSIGLFVVYFILVKAATAFGVRGSIEPLWAALAPNLAMLGVGLGFFARLR